MVNRSVLILKAKEPFRQWINSLPESEDITLAEINEDTTSYLIPEYGDDVGKDKILKKIFKVIFEDELSNWWKDENDWPIKRDMRTFKLWFDVEFHSIVVDLLDAELIDED